MPKKAHMTEAEAALSKAAAALKATPNADTLAAFEAAAAAVKAAGAEPDDPPEPPTPPVDTEWLQEDVLDRSKPYGSVYGEGAKMYFQNGKYYDRLGQVIKE